MHLFRRSLLSIGRVGAVALMAFVSIFVVREIFIRNMQHEAHLDDGHPARSLVYCMNAQVRVGNPVDTSAFGTLHTARVIARSRDFAVLIGGRDIRGRWVVVADFRSDPPQVYDARAVVDPSIVAVQHGISNFGTTSAFRACGAEYAGLLPPRPEEWAAMFNDPFFEDHAQWTQRR